MKDRLGKVSYFAFLFGVLCLFSVIPVKTAHSQYACLPTCSTIDGRFFVLAAMGLATANNRDAEFHITSPGESQTFEIGVFDGEGEIGNWDINNAPFVVLRFSLFLDPNGDGTGDELLYREWSSDGSFGDNIGEPMPNDDWFIQTIQNAEQARTSEGHFSYRMVVRNLNPDALALNGFKVRADGTLSIPARAAFNYSSTPREFEDFEVIYPNIDFGDPACADIDRPGLFCDPSTDPDCCLIPTTYDGTWSFCFVVPEEIDTLDIWDGDFDFGSASLNADGDCVTPDNVSLDTDDPNTPIPLPQWALGTDAITQGVSVPTNPADDNGCLFSTVRPPSVNYTLDGPNGVSYLNDNPSGNIEWELFNISTLPFNPLLYDISVESIEMGLWCVRTFGNDSNNLNSLRIPYPVIGVDDEGNPVFPPDMTASIPTLSEWGLVVLSIFVMLAAVYYLRFRKERFNSK